MDKVSVKSIGKQGDGIAVTDAGQECFVPYSLPGETLSVSGKGKRREIAEIVSASGDRQDPICKYFGTCGGCQMQHMADASYDAWKLALLNEALAREQIEAKADRLITFDVAGRRRAVLSACRLDGELVVGFAKSNSHDLVDIDTCPVLTPTLNEALPDIRTFAASLPLGKNPVKLAVLETQAGIDVAVQDIRQPAEAQKQGFVKRALDLGFARLTIADEILIEARKPYLPMGMANVIPPPAAFVQANANAEETMAKLVTEHLAPCKSVVDLFCGVGTFALRLAENSSVWALEEHDAAISALDQAWRETGGKLRQISAEARNLERRPASFKELKKFQGAVFDPPRAGAELQAMQIAKSKLQRVAAVSCNPITLARDLKILMDGGFKITGIVAIDQFRFTPHLEVVALLEK